MILRDRSTLNNGTLDERLWVQQDANWNVTTLVNGSGSVVERYVYDPYGKITFLTASWGTRSASAYAFISLFQGGRFDTTTELFSFRNRDLSSTTGRWTSADPIGLGPDSNLYRYVRNNPTNALDPSGLDVYLLLDSRASCCKGHAAVLVGPVDLPIKGVKHKALQGPGKDKWVYLSFAPGSWATTKDNLTVLVFDSIEQFREAMMKGKEPRLYDLALGYRTDKDKSIEAIKAALKFENKPWWLILRNCGDMAKAAMKAAGIDVKDALSPMEIWRKNFDSADEKGLIRIKPELVPPPKPSK
jgi:RHS repeat-associated protein